MRRLTQYYSIIDSVYDIDQSYNDNEINGASCLIVLLKSCTGNRTIILVLVYLSLIIFPKFVGDNYKYLCKAS